MMLAEVRAFNSSELKPVTTTVRDLCEWTAIGDWPVAQRQVSAAESAEAATGAGREGTGTGAATGEAVRMHGTLGSQHWALPTRVTAFDVAARDYCSDKIMAHEYLDSDSVLREKVKVLADMVRRSRRMLAFTGAGISTAAGIDDYASKAKGASVTAAGKPVLKDWKKARPTRAHRCLVAMYEAGLLKHWINQNHDSLPQKAGFPQDALNEIHGSLHDPANPVVPYEGSLRDDLFAWMAEWQAQNDLCLAVGTSLSGFNVDSVAEVAIQNARERRSHGLVVINLQATPYDDGCSLRIFGKADSVLELLAAELQLVPRPMDADYEPRVEPESIVAEDVVRVRFDANGDPCDDVARMEVWDLRVGQRVRLTGGPYAGDVGTIMEKVEGHYRIRFADSLNRTFNVTRRPFSLWLGSWWLQQATRGLGVTPGGKAPLVNVREAGQAQ